MVKKSKKRQKNIIQQSVEELSEFPEYIESKFKSILRIMSWIVGVSFILIIILPNFDFVLVDEIVKFIFYLGVFNLLLFAVLEIFANPVKKTMSKYISEAGN
jgi:hypothetical protein